SMVHILGRGRRTGVQPLADALVARCETGWGLQGSETVRFTVSKHKPATNEARWARATPPRLTPRLGPTDYGRPAVPAVRPRPRPVPPGVAPAPVPRRQGQGVAPQHARPLRAGPVEGRRPEQRGGAAAGAAAAAAGRPGRHPRLGPGR